MSHSGEWSIGQSPMACDFQSPLQRRVRLGKAQWLATFSRNRDLDEVEESQSRPLAEAIYTSETFIIISFKQYSIYIYNLNKSYSV